MVTEGSALPTPVMQSRLTGKKLCVSEGNEGTII
jgi:hypothetical protein